MQEGQVSLTLLKGEFYVDKDWQPQSSIMEGVYSQAFIGGQIRLISNAMPIDTKEDFWEFAEKDGTAKNGQYKELGDTSIRMVSYQRTKVNGFAAYKVSYRQGVMEAEEYAIYMGENVLHAY